MWRPDKKDWTRQDELQVQSMELFDSYMREVTYLLSIQASGFQTKKPPNKFPGPRVSITHPDRPTAPGPQQQRRAAPRRRPDGSFDRVPARIDPKQAEKFFGRLAGGRG